MFGGRCVPIWNISGAIMIRFCKKEDISHEDYELALTREPMLLNESIWKKGKEIFKCTPHDNNSLFLIPVINKTGNNICFAYEDNEANRELRFLEEIQETDGALQFTDIFPGKKSVTIQGCNELAYCFLQYMNKIGVTVYVVGEYWNELGYYQTYRESDTHNLMIYAEGTNQEWIDGYSVNAFLCSVSAEFECIDQIYEENVRQGFIKDAVCSFEVLIEHLKAEDEIAIMGIGDQSQDAYDLLLDKGIDICCFMQDGFSYPRKLFGKPIFCRNEIFKNLNKPVFIRCMDSHSALGTEAVNDYNYYGYKRNKSFFVLNDYTVVPESRLIHILCDKKIVLAGDERLCNILNNFYQRELGGRIRIRYTNNILNEGLEDEIAVLAFHKPYGANQLVEKQLEIVNFINEQWVDCTEYFERIEHFMGIERESQKYKLDSVRPKGILLGCIPGLSGNIFFRSILDGHTQILKMESSFINNNLFSFCIRLCHEMSQNIFRLFWEIYNEEADADAEFIDKEKFNRKLLELLELSDRFTSQELFVIFTTAYEAMYDIEAFALADRIIYWEPHGCSRDVFGQYARWLEDEKIIGNTVRIARNEIVRAGSILNNYYDYYGYLDDTDYWKLMDTTSIYNIKGYQGNYWDEFTVRFEDLKLIPNQVIQKICEKTGIHWEESLLRTTCRGEESYYQSTTGFSLRPVYDNYENYFSTFDRFRISMIYAHIQKQYRYPHLETTSFSRRELQAIYLKDFRFEGQIEFKSYKNKMFYKRQIYHTLNILLWKIRKFFLLKQLSEISMNSEYDDICDVHRYRDTLKNN